MARPKSFIPDEALDAAMGVFWDKGFEAASVQDLTDAMGINRFSMYDTFGDKRQLYLKALDRYADTVVKKQLSKLGQLSSLDDLEAHMTRVAEAGRCPDSKCGCLMQRASIETASHDDGSRERVERVHDAMHSGLMGVLRRAREKGELASGVRVPDAAWALLVLQVGLAGFDAAPLPAKAVRSAIRAAIAPLRA